MPNCRELTRMLACDELVEAGWSQRLEGRVHLLMCRHCRRYAAQLGALGAWARRSWGAKAEDAERLEQLQGRILQRFPEGSAGSTSTGPGPDATSPDPDEPKRP